MKIESYGGNQGYPELRATVKKHVEFYAPLLGLEGWSIKLKFKGIKKQTYAQTEADWPYLNGVVTFDLVRMTAGLDEEGVRLTVVHELLHLVTWRFMAICQGLLNHANDQLLRELEEEFVTQLERMPLWKDIK